MIRLGLCCLFRDQPIRFRRTTAAALLKWPPKRRGEILSSIARDNAQALMQALMYCAHQGIGCFRVNSQILPLTTHPKAGYVVEDLPASGELTALFKACGSFARKHHLRLSFHPDQFVLLNSPRLEVVRSSVRELEYQARLAEWIGADVINIHGGGGYGDKKSALNRLRKNLDLLSPQVRKRLTLENDDRVYTLSDLLPVCREESIPLVYDLHHHRCLPDGRSVEKATQLALTTWNREPLFHLSSPLAGWRGGNPRPHHDFIDPADFPKEWKTLDVTIEVEAKAKEVAVLRLLRDMKIRPWKTHLAAVKD
ncbi:MAG: UV DNA damage repair endonuclease UvsE [Lentisphaerota bacterium]